MSNAPEILAFCGFAGSGKNTAGDYILQMSHRTAQPSVQLAFAGALKDAVSVIFQWDRRLLDGDTDSSRLWPADQYREGISPPSFDKQFVRDYLETLTWNKQPPAPHLPPDVINKTAEKYREARDKLIGG